jgi:hypothetical protein
MCKRKRKRNFPDSFALFINGRIDKTGSNNTPKYTTIPLPIKLIGSLIQELGPNKIPGPFQPLQPTFSGLYLRLPAQNHIFHLSESFKGTMEIVGVVLVELGLGFLV